MNKIIIVASDTKLIQALRESAPAKGFKIVDVLKDKDALFDDLEKYSKLNDMPDTLFVTDGFDPTSKIPTWQTLIEIKEKYPKLKVAFATGDIDKSDSERMYSLAQLVKAGIYDLIVGSSVEKNEVFDFLKLDHKLEDVSGILVYDKEINNKTFDSNLGINNVVLISSMKPGSGKTFLATNLAVAIAKFGQNKRLENGQLIRPRVAIVDADMLNFSVMTALRLDDKDKNMITALNQIRRYVTSSGKYSIKEEDQKDIVRLVRSCMVGYKGIPNLWCIGAPETDFETLNKISPAHFLFLIECLINAFDIIIIDSNSSFDHQTTAAAFEVASNIYLTLDLDYNNIQNNIRYYKKLQEMGYEQKLHYILNKDLPLDVKVSYLSDISYDLMELNRNGIMIDFRIPQVSAAKIKALDYGAKLLIDDRSPDTKAAREAVLEVANDIWKIDYRSVEEAFAIEEIYEEDIEEVNKKKIFNASKLVSNVKDILNK